MRTSFLRPYLDLTKSGIVMLVGMTALAGYLAGQSFEVSLDFFYLARTLLGIMALAAGSSALNQIQEIEIDRKMPRTSRRPLVTGTLTKRQALVTSTALLLLGLGLLFKTNWITFALGLLAVFSYNVLYTRWWKPTHPFAAIPGALPGALPVLMGYTAVAFDPLSPQGLYLFAILFLWQMPHFWALAIRYREDYAEGGIPTLPVSFGEQATLRHVTLWALAYVGTSLLAPLFFSVGAIYLIPAILMGVKVLLELRRFKRSKDRSSWLRFFLWINFSLVIYLFAVPIDLWSIYLWVPLTQ